MSECEQRLWSRGCPCLPSPGHSKGTRVGQSVLALGTGEGRGGWGLCCVLPVPSASPSPAVPKATGAGDSPSDAVSPSG